jgi:hypothetical protein
MEAAAAAHSHGLEDLMAAVVVGGERMPSSWLCGQRRGRGEGGRVGAKDLRRSPEARMSSK